jgi:hypothetical protein
VRLTSALGDYAVARSDGMADDHPVNRIVAVALVEIRGRETFKALVSGWDLLMARASR